MASPVGEREGSNSTGDEHEPAPAPNHPEQSHPEPACVEAQKWIEAVTGRSFGDKDFRGGLENGILLCELLSSIKPGLVKKINRLPTPIAGLDNLSVFLKGCEELGLKGSQLFDPGDLQDTSIRANLKDSECNRKLKNVLITVFWLGKAASGNATYNGPTLNLKEFEGLLSHMRTECEDAGDCTRRSVRDSGYDCWDSERSDSLSPPRHARDDSLDSLDSFGSRSQHSPSPDVAHRGNSDGDSEVDNRKPDVRRDDMLARRTAGGSESRSSVPFNQFLPNRANATAYVPTPRRKVHAEDGEQRRMSRRVAHVTEDSESMSMSDMRSEEEAEHVQPLGLSRYERMQEQYNHNLEEEDHWRDDLARWKNRRRSASQELIRKEEERKRMEKRMKEEGMDAHKRKSIKTYREIVEEKERREAELCEAYRRAETPEEAAMVLQRYALRFTISDATLDSLKLPRIGPDYQPDSTKPDLKIKPAHTTVDQEQRVAKNGQENQSKPEPKQEAEKNDPRTQECVSAASLPSPPAPSDPPTVPHTQVQNAEPQTRHAHTEPRMPEPTPKQAHPEVQQAQPQPQPTQAHTQHAQPQPQPTQAHTQHAQPQPQPTQAHTQHAQPQPQPTQAHTQHAQLQPQPTQAHTQHAQLQPQPTQAHTQHAQLQPQPTQAHTQHAQLQPQPTQAHSQQAQPKPPHTEPQSLQAQPPPYGHTRLSPASSGTPPSRPMPLLTAKPYSQPKHIQTGHKAVKVEGLVHVNGKSVEEGMSVPPLPSSPLHSPEGSKAPPTQQATANQTTNETLTPQQPELVATTTSGSSAISSLIGGRNCIVTTTIVTELSQTYMEPYPSNLPSNTQINGTMGLLLQQDGEQKEVLSGSAPFSYQQTYSPTVTEGLEESNVTIETPMLNLAKRVNHWVWDPNEERKRQERWQQEQERLLQEQYQREQGKLKEEWERAQKEVEEEERRHNEEERQILEETVAPLNLSTLSKQPSQVEAISSAQQDSLTKTNAPTVLSHKVATITLDLEMEARDTPKQNNQRVPMMSEDQHGVSQLRFVQDASWENERKQELWKTSSLDRNAQLIQPSTVKRSGSHDNVGTHSPSSSPQPTSSSRCVSGKKLCSGCSLPLGKGAAMIIDTLGLFFHIQCFKCGVCEGQLGTTRAGTDVRIRNGVLSCHECYITTSAGHPTTL
ncbi:LIM and calponin homology domains-containing protein 1-like isoform X2 [Hypomesus transpacificus]|uniref:LIM and calponin homology domains-containing protein 1-like isoform X2 n=1 Tax=Hypomesus transpacificus TaxID=137520 RepID=UPI001F078393|nr:LIM and calponin homology domains-containing protein 1-like isoform X2 [Hypomesus transpacificus]